MSEYTVKQIAEMLNVSKPTIQRVINAEQIKPDREDKHHTRLYGYEKTVEIIKIIKTDFDFSVLSPSGETPPQTSPNTANFGETPPQTSPNTAKTAPPIGDAEVMAKMVDMLQKQLEAKDKQIADLTRILEDTNQKLTETLKNQKYIEAVEKTQEFKEYIDSKEVVPEQVPDIVQEEPKKKWWQKFLGM